MRPGVDFVVVRPKKITFTDCETKPGHGGHAAPSVGEFPTYGVGGRETKGEGMEKVWGDHGRECVVEVCEGFIGGAEGAVGEDVGTVGQV